MEVGRRWVHAILRPKNIDWRKPALDILGFFSHFLVCMIGNVPYFTAQTYASVLSWGELATTPAYLMPLIFCFHGVPDKNVISPGNRVFQFFDQATPFY